MQVLGSSFCLFLKVVLLKFIKNQRKFIKSKLIFIKWGTKFIIIYNPHNSSAVAEGHLLGIVVTMKGYPAVIVDIIGFCALKGKTPKWYSYSYSEFSSKKEKNIYRDYRGRPPQLSMFNSKKEKKHFWWL